MRRKKAEAERKERERIEKIERDHTDELLKAVGSWRQAAEIRAYVHAVVAMVKTTVNQLLMGKVAYSSFIFTVCSLLMNTGIY